MLATDDLFPSYQEWANLNYCSIFLGVNVLILLKLLQLFALRSLLIETQILSLNNAVLFHVDKYKYKDSRVIKL